MERSSGVLLPVSALPGSYSIGSFGAEARGFVDFLCEAGFRFWQVLPFCVPDAYHSPYASYSSFSGNVFYIDLPTLREEGLITKEELADARQKTPYACEFERLEQERYALLRRAAARVPAAERGEIAAAMAARPHVDAFCRFMALCRRNGGARWTDFTELAPDPDELFFWQFTQHRFLRQWNELHEYARSRGVRVLGDIPIYVSYDSADVWSNPELFCLDARNRPTAVAGVPPDYFSETGQLWGNPLYRWDVMAQDGFSWWRDRIAHMAELFDGVRLDHFRGFASYYAVPAGAADAREGEWRSGPGMPLIRALREAAPDTLLVAEDLGVQTPDVARLLEESGLPGMRVLQFAFPDHDGSIHLPHNYHKNSVVYTGTHDNNTMFGYLYEMEPQDRARLMEYCGLSPDRWMDSRNAILRTMLSSHADLAIFPVQDLLFFGRDTRLNTPGRADGNWAYRVTAEQLHSIDAAYLRRQNELYGRIEAERAVRPH